MIAVHSEPDYVTGALSPVETKVSDLILCQAGDRRRARRTRRARVRHIRGQTSLNWSSRPRALAIKPAGRGDYDEQETLSPAAAPPVESGQTLAV